MSWIFLAILAYFLWAITNIIDKIIVSKYIKDYFALSLLCLLFGSLFTLIYSISVSGLHLISLTVLIIALLAGLARALAYYFYYKAVSYEEASRVVILTQLAPIITLLLSVLFIKETLNNNGYIAFTLLLFAGILASLKFNQEKTRISYAFWDMILFAIFISASAVMMKYVFRLENFWQCMIWIVTGEILSVTLISLIFKKPIIKIFLQTLAKGRLLIILDEIFSSSALIIYSLALTLGSVSLITALSSVNPIFVFVIAVIISTFIPKILKEEVDKKTIVFKISAIIVMGLGLYLLR